MASSDNGAFGFRDLGLPESVLQAVKNLGYEAPTEVQKAVFRPACEGKDLVVQARTGTGKTSAFGLPLIGSLIRISTPAVQALILCPTRELALQVAKELTQLAKPSGIGVVAVYGGAPLGGQTLALEKGAHIVVGTPGRILDHLERRTLDVSSVKRFVLDEADEMLSMGFLPQITEIWEKLPAQRQVLLFSATVGREVLRIANSRLKDPTFIALSGDHVGALEVSHYFYHSQGNKLNELVQILEVEDPESAIIFCNTRDETKRVAQMLSERGYPADWLSADLSQAEREKVMQATRDSKLRYLVCTDVAARGIDISHLTHVINYDFPESTDGYVHRTGRTGRAGRMGTAVSLVAPGSIGDLYYLKLRYKIDPIERQLPSPAEIATREESDFLEELGRRLPRSSNLALRLSRRFLTRDDAEQFGARLIAQGLDSLALDAGQMGHKRRARVKVAAGPVESPPSRNARSQNVAAAPAVVERTPNLERASSSESSSEHESKVSMARPREVPPSASSRSARNSRETRHVLHGIGYTVSDAQTRAGSGTSGATADREKARPDRAAPDRAAPDRVDRQRSEHEAHQDKPDPNRAGTPSRRRGEPEPIAKGDVADGPRGERAARLSEVYVNVGKRDGATSDDFVAVLRAQGIELTGESYVHVRSAHSFIGVKADDVERVIQALEGAEIAHKRASAERARVPRVQSRE